MHPHVIAPGGYEMIDAALETARTEWFHLSSKHDIVSWYQQSYPKNWQSRLSKDIAEVAGGKTKASSYARNFRPDRINRKATPGFAEKLRKVGEQKIPAQEREKKVSGKRARVKTNIRMRISKDKKDRLKKIDVTINASQASRLRKGDLDGVIEAYGGINPNEIVSAEIDTFHLEYV